ncbi:U2-type spliceosomal complex subunit CWC24 [Rhodotorula paludigena]|uniref:U2-type spliceosomal complex subunit CWC24 n=1 Tax=Rhodotorula paludigena TaxID=86838 RepID=UPI003179E006
MSNADAPVTFMKKRKGAPSGLRKKPAADAAASSSAVADEPATSEVVHGTKRAVASHLIQGTGSKRRKAQEDASLAALSDSDDDKEQDRERSSYAVRHSADRQAQRRRSESPPAWVSSDQIKEMARDKDAPPEETPDDGLYRGANKQKNQLPKAFGPVKGGPGNVRQITLVDYQPDVCKDYKETGFCGFGDTCKFLHDRGDYMHGWQLDNSFLSNSASAGSFMAKQRARDGGDDDSDSDSDNEDLPFACLICRKPFGPDPVVTLCGHYFDSACAIKRYAKTGKCFACGASTNGVFNRAKKLIEKQKEREALNAKAREEEEGEEGDDNGGIEIEGLADASADPHAGHKRRAPAHSEEEEDDDDEEEEEERPRKRPIIEIQ